MSEEIKLTPLERMKLASKKNYEREKINQERKAVKREKKKADKILEHELTGKKPRTKKKKKIDPLAPWNRVSGSAFSGKRSK